MKIVICGAGHVGQNLVHYLSSDYEIVLIDKDRSILEKTQANYDVQTICGNSSDLNILKKAQIQEDSAIVAVTESDEVNIITCQLAGFIFGASFKAARLRNESFFQETWHEKIKESFQIDLIFSQERNAAEAILQSFHVPYAFDTYYFASKELILIGIQIDSKSAIIHHTINSIYHVLAAFDVKIIRIIRNYQAFIPHKNDQIIANDALYFITPSSQKREVMKALGYAHESSKSVIIFGASAVSKHVLTTLADTECAVVVIDESAEQIKKIAPYCSKALFLKGSPLNPDVLKEANVSKATYAIATTSDDTVNILSALMAHSYGVVHCLALMQRIGYLSPLFALGIEKMIHPAQLIMAFLLQKLTKKYVLSFYPLEGEFSGMVIESIVQEKSKAIGLSTEVLDDERIQVLAVVRDRQIIWNSTILQLGDCVILTTLPDGYQVFQRLFGNTT
jgi:trk system potassium uptake protein TrkA